MEKSLARYFKAESVEGTSDAHMCTEDAFVCVLVSREAEFWKLELHPRFFLYKIKSALILYLMHSSNIFLWYAGIFLC